MSQYRRWYSPGSMYFFTVVTYRRQPIFQNASAWNFLREAILMVKRTYPFNIAGFILLPDHLHAIWQLPEGDSNYSVRWNLIKSRFTRLYLKNNIEYAPTSISRIRKRERPFWQRRFWEHFIRDEKDFIHHLDYIHYNPVKHGYSTRSQDWPWSTFNRYVKEGWYPSDWGTSEPNDLLITCVGE